MLRFAADENFNNALVRGLRRSLPGIDIVRIQDEGLTGSPDPEVLDWCAKQGRLLLTHDINTMPDHLVDRLQQGKVGVGVVLVRTPNYSMRQIIEDLILMAQCSDASEWLDRCNFLPLR